MSALFLFKILVLHVRILRVLLKHHNRYGNSLLAIFPHKGYMGFFYAARRIPKFVNIICTNEINFLTLRC